LLFLMFGTFLMSMIFSFRNTWWWNRSCIYWWSCFAVPGGRGSQPQNTERDHTWEFVISLDALFIIHYAGWSIVWGGVKIFNLKDDSMTLCLVSMYTGSLQHKKLVPPLSRSWFTISLIS
jgi:hypothetical protein